MFGVIKAALLGVSRFFGGGALDRVLDTLDRRVAAQADKDRITGEILQAHLNTRPDFMRAGGFVLMLLFAAPTAFHFSAVVLYSVFWCQDCAFPATWTIAALPNPFNEWIGLMMISIFGVVGVSEFRR